MVDLQIATLTGRDTVIEDTAVEDFKSSLRGRLLRTGDEGYDEARKVWNGMIDKRPAAIAQCSGVADVINSVDFARTNNLLVSVRGGGHNIPGSSVCDGGIMIDLGGLKSVRVDPASRTARAELRTAGRPKEQVRPHQLFPAQPEHQADGRLVRCRPHVH